MIEVQPTRAAKTDELALQLETLILGGLVLFLVLLPFHLVVKELLPGPMGTYWKEILLGLLVLVWVILSVIERRPLLTGTLIDLAVLAYLALMGVGFVVARGGQTAAWGLYVSVMYLPLVWLVPAALAHRPAWTERLVLLLVGVGAVVGIGGLVEFLLNRALWPSIEMVSRQGFPDVFVYGTHLRRVYFVLDSPTALANMLSVLLPMALALMLLAHRSWVRVALAGAAALMAACIVVTFSRGIWIATLLSLPVMVVLSGFLHLSRRVLVGGAVALALALLTWGAVALVRPGQAVPVGPDLVELTSTAYQAAPVNGAVTELLSTPPMNQQATFQTWTIHDSIAGLDDTRTVLYQAPVESGGNEITYRLNVPQGGALRYAIAMSPAVWSPEKGDGANFLIYIAQSDAGQGRRMIFNRYINPKLSLGDRQWRNFLLDLSPWAGQTVDLALATDAGPAGDFDFDWAGWAAPQVVSLAPGYFTSAQTDNQAVQHASSVLNWTTDETNRDRLVAWKTALTAWRGSPLWGQGLGYTGVAALRTNPEQAFVTESQILKALVEFGLLGLLSLAFLWAMIGYVGYRAYRTSADMGKRVLLLGILTSLLVIFIEGWVYQNLEVKQVNAYFWTMAGALGYLSGKPK